MNQGEGSWLALSQDMSPFLETNHSGILPLVFQLMS